MLNESPILNSYASAKSHAESLSEKLVGKYGVNKDVSQSTVNFRSVLDNIAVPDAESILAAGNEDDITDYYNLVNVLKKGQDADLYTTQDVLTRRAYDDFGYDSGELAAAAQQFKDWYYQARDDSYRGALPAQLTVDGYLKYSAGEINSYEDYLSYAGDIHTDRQREADETAEMRRKLDLEIGHYSRREVEFDSKPNTGADEAVVRAEAGAEQQITDALTTHGVDRAVAMQTASSVVFHGLQYSLEPTKEQQLKLTSKVALSSVVSTINELENSSPARISWQAILEQVNERHSERLK
jgi:hypothetical protein